MLKQTAFRTASAAMVLMLGACSWLQQPAAPVIAGTAGSITESTQSAGMHQNPYGAAPYQPNAAEPAPYVAHAAPQPSGGTYIPSYAPVDINAATHTVVRGDTVYNISKRYQISQDDLRAWNGLADNNISIGRVLRVKPAGYVAQAPKVSAPAAPAPVKTAPVVSAPVTVAPAPAAPVASGSVPSATRQAAGITWQRPTAGPVISKFGGNNKGIDIAGSQGQVVVAAADGKVVYAGYVPKYGNLVIVQHNQTYLTAYGHNQKLLVKDGQTVKRGQSVALMGSSDADRAKLRFELRKVGKPVNPNEYLPL